jgi:hypothetical protein
MGCYLYEDAARFHIENIITFVQKIPHEGYGTRNTPLDGIPRIANWGFSQTGLKWDLACNVFLTCDYPSPTVFPTNVWNDNYIENSVNSAKPLGSLYMESTLKLLQYVSS